MPDITDPEAISFCNEFIRPSADKLGTLFYECPRSEHNSWRCYGYARWLAVGADGSIRANLHPGNAPRFRSQHSF